MATQIIIAFQPVEIDGKHWVSLSLNGREIKRGGPFPSASVAGAMADQLVLAWRTSTWAQAARGMKDIASAFEGRIF